MISRRGFLQWLFALSSLVFSGCLVREEGSEEKPKESDRGAPMERVFHSRVYVIKTDDRASGIRELMQHFDLGSGKRVALKANYNSADAFPASTHLDTLSAVVDILKENGASVILAERSGMGDTRKVLEDTGVMQLSGRKEFDVVVLDDVKSSGWIKEAPDGSHWKRGYLFPVVFREADAVVQICCLKTHRYGGHFTMSLKNSVGMAAKYDPGDGYNYMSELHVSRDQRKMIAEINSSYDPALVIMDGILGFSKGGPDTGTLIEPGIMLASTDRVALDAAGVAVLRMYGTTREVSAGEIFAQEQIARAGELGLGASKPEEIEVVPLNDGAREICSRIEDILTGRKGTFSQG